MLRSLWKLQWKQFAARMKKGNGKKTSGGWLVFLMLFFVVCMEILMFVVFAELVPLCEMGLTWLYFAMAGTMALAFSMFHQRRESGRRYRPERAAAAHGHRSGEGRHGYHDGR